MPKTAKNADDGPKGRVSKGPQGPPSLNIVSGDGASGLLTGLGPVTPLSPSAQRLHRGASGRDFVAVRAVLAELAAAEGPAPDIATVVAAPQGKVDEADGWGRTPLLVACRRGDPMTVALLLANGASHAVVSRQGTPLQAAAVKYAASSNGEEQARFAEVARLLLTRGVVEEDFALQYGTSLLHRVAAHTNPAFLSALLEHEEFLARCKQTSLVDADGHRLFHVASPAARQAIKAAIKASGKAKRKPSVDVILECAKGDNVFAVARCLEAYNEDVMEPLGPVVRTNKHGEREESLLAIAAAAGAASVVAYLVRWGAPDWRDRYGFCALSRAVLNGHVQVVRLLLSAPHLHGTYKAAPETLVTVNDETLLHAAIHSKSPTMVHVIGKWAGAPGCSFSADALQVANKQGIAPKDLAMSLGMKDALASLNAVQESLKTPAPEAGTPVFPEPSGLACAVCLLPPPDPEDALLYCECNAPTCTECLQLQIESARREGKYPVCWNAECGAPVSVEHMFNFAASERNTFVAIMINKEIRAGMAMPEECIVCARVNDIADLAGPRFACSHCGVHACSVCKTIWGSDPRDARVHAVCTRNFPLLRLISEFHDVVNARACCSQCGRGGTKDDNCSHITCECGHEYCYVCGNDGTACQRKSWQNDTTGCPMYIARLGEKDARILHARHPPGCPDCDRARQEPPATFENPHMPCTRAADNAAGAILDTIRVRIRILKFAAACGMENFHLMAQLGNLKETLDVNYFDNRFPWTSPSVPDWWTFEPAEVQEFYRLREGWFVRKDPEI